MSEMEEQSQVHQNEEMSSMTNPLLPPGPPSNMVGDSESIPTLLRNEEKNYKDVCDLLKFGVELPVIANVKNTSVEEVLAFIHLKSINIPQDDSLQRPKKRKNSWKRDDFPKDKGENDEYFCGDCKQYNKTYHCGNCNRKCWKWCGKCGGFFSNHHSCFKNEASKKRKRSWKRKDFPTEKKGLYFCADCQKSNPKRLCVCGRDCWKWCELCSSYYSKHHFPCNRMMYQEDKMGLDNSELNLNDLRNMQGFPQDHDGSSILPSVNVMQEFARLNETQQHELARQLVGDSQLGHLHVPQSSHVVMEIPTIPQDDNGQRDHLHGMSHDQNEQIPQHHEMQPHEIHQQHIPPPIPQPPHPYDDDDGEKQIERELEAIEPPLKKRKIMKD